MFINFQLSIFNWIMLRLAIIESSVLFRLGIKAVFESIPDMYIAGEASHEAALFGLLAHTSADVVLLSVNMPDATIYVDVIRHIRCHYPSVKILAIADEGTTQIVQSMMEAGISGFIGKRQANRKELEKAVRRIAAGGKYVGKIDSNNHQKANSKKAKDVRKKIRKKQSSPTFSETV